MSLDAEDGGPDNYHGPSSAYGTVLNTILDHVRTDAMDVLVVGAGKAADDDVTLFWTQVGDWMDRDLYFVNGADGIAEVDFSNYATVIVVSNDVETPDGGLSLSEQYALEDRASDISDFINSGGGLWGLMQGGFPAPFSYLETSVDFVVDSGHAFRYMTPSVKGVQSGVNEVFEVCCWHDEILQYPESMNVLAVRTKNDAAIAVGGLNTYLGDFKPISLDYRPRRNPNYLKIKKEHKRVSLAINGTEDFDVNDIDVSSLNILGLEPEKLVYKDVSTPYDDYLSKQSHRDGADPVSDGYTDLLLRYSAEEFREAIGTLVHGETVVVELEGNLLDGTEIRGMDVFMIRNGKDKEPVEKKDKKNKKDRKEKKVKDGSDKHHKRR